MSKEAAEAAVSIVRGAEMRPHQVSDLLITVVQAGAATPGELLQAAAEAKHR